MTIASAYSKIKTLGEPVVAETIIPSNHALISTSNTSNNSTNNIVVDGGLIPVIPSTKTLYVDLSSPTTILTFSSGSFAATGSGATANLIIGTIGATSTVGLSTGQYVYLTFGSNRDPFPYVITAVGSNYYTVSSSNGLYYFNISSTLTKVELCTGIGTVVYPFNCLNQCIDYIATNSLKNYTIKIGGGQYYTDKNLGNDNNYEGDIGSSISFLGQVDAATYSYNSFLINIGTSISNPNNYIGCNVYQPTQSCYFKNIIFTTYDYRSSTYNPGGIISYTGTSTYNSNLMTFQYCSFDSKSGTGGSSANTIYNEVNILFDNCNITQSGIKSPIKINCTNSTLTYGCFTTLKNNTLVSNGGGSSQAPQLIDLITAWFLKITNSELFCGGYSNGQIGINFDISSTNSGSVNTLILNNVLFQGNANAIALNINYSSTIIGGYTLNNTTTVIGSTSGLIVGMGVSGTNIPSNTVISSITTTPAGFIMNNAATGTASSQPLTFKGFSGISYNNIIDFSAINSGGIQNHTFCQSGCTIQLRTINVIFQTATPVAVTTSGYTPTITTSPIAPISG
jgi:hypothetical protein